jgi:hypothetical protein
MKSDFLTWRPCGARNPIVIGNPPFGRNSKLAIAFFNHAATFAGRIAFILPRSFEKESVQVRLDRRFHLEGQMRMRGHSFHLAGKARDVPAVWQVWRRCDDLRSVDRGAITHPDFVFCSAEDADFAVQRVGAKAGAVKRGPRQAAPSSHHFIRAVRQGDEDLAEIFEDLDCEAVKERTAGNPSISKRELIALYSARARAISDCSARRVR